MADDNLIKELIEEIHALRLAVLAVAAAVLSKQVLDSTDFSNTQAADSLSDLMDRVASINTTRV